MAAYQVTLLNDQGLNATIEVTDNQTIFDAAEAADIALPISCRTGTCTTCTGKVVSGEVAHTTAVCLDDTEVATGFVLTCVAAPKSDCTIQTHQADAL